MTYADGSTITSATHVAHLNPFRYRGYMYDEETGFYYLRSRYYDPEVGRFLNADALVSTDTGLMGYNMFAYCNNNPVKYADSSGLIPIIIVPNADMYNEYIKTGKESVADETIGVDYDEIYGTSYICNDDGTVRIENSYRITNIFTMYNYINSHRGNEIMGTTTGVVFEWALHNLAYSIAEIITHLDVPDSLLKGAEKVMERSGNLDIGRTIYDDDHGIPTNIMLNWYRLFFPISSVIDYFIYCDREQK